MSIDGHTQWLQTPIGAYLQAQEQALFDDAVSNVFGFNALQLGLLEMDLLRNSRIPYLIRAGQDAGVLQCDPEHLPFSANSMDLVLLPHILEFSANPHQALREAERILVPEGHLMLTGFNPISAWGMRRFISKRESYPWNGRFFSLLRIKDWLELLGFELVAGHMACYVPPCRNPAWFNKFRFMDKAGDRWWPMMGGVYFVTAKKRVIGMRLIRPNWHKSKLNPGLVPTPSQKKNQKKKQHSG
jgi:SAM-dependent methyltransferase